MPAETLQTSGSDSPDSDVEVSDEEGFPPLPEW